MKSKTNPLNKKHFFKSKNLFKKFNYFFIFLFIFFLPTQFGKHFFFNFSYIFGVRIDYLAPTLYLIDLLFFFLLIINIKKIVFLLFNKKFLIFFILSLINLAMSLNKWVAFYYFLRIFQVIFIYFIFKKNQIKKKSFLLIIFFSTLLQFTIVSLQLINKGSLQGVFYFLGERFYYQGLPGVAKVFFNGKEIVRPYGTFSHPNSMAGFYLLLYFYFINLKFLDWFLLKNLLFFLLAFLIFFSFSKISISVFLILNFLFFIKKKGNCHLCLFSRFFIFLLMFFVFISFNGDPLSFKNRLTLIKDSLLIIKENPLFGVGLGNYLIAQNKIKKYLYYSPITNQPVHNIFFLLYAQTGVLSFIGLFLIKDLLFKKIKKNPYLFLALFLTGLFDHYWLTLIQNLLLIPVVFAFL